MNSSPTVATKKPDPWLQRYLELIGRWNADGIGRGLRARACTRCAVTCLAGLDADRAGLPVWLHPAPLNALGEAVALLLNIPTYSLHRRRNGLQADLRDTAAIRKRPTTIIEVMAEHRCGLTLPERLYRPRPVPLPPTTKPPF
jgi:hypothetical protein